jgi:hypothetical protein
LTWTRNADLLSGLILVVLGVATAVYTVVSYKLGTFSRMGPGMFPLIVGVVIAGLGLLVLVPAIWRPAALPKIHWREFSTVTAGILAFAALIESAGFVPAIIVLTFISALAEHPYRLRRTVVLSIGLSVAAFLLFRVGLSLPIAAFRWAF